MPEFACHWTRGSCAPRDPAPLWQRVGDLERPGRAMMQSQRLSVVVTRRLPDRIETRLGELFNAELSADDRPMGRRALIRAGQQADVLVPTITDRIDAEMLDEMGDRLKLIANYGAGVDHIDVQ